MKKVLDKLAASIVTRFVLLTLGVMIVLFGVIFPQRTMVAIKAAAKEM